MGQVSADFPMCQYFKGQTCFAYRDGGCTILRETYQNSLECRFYKSRAQIDKELRLTKDRIGYAKKFV